MTEWEVWLADGRRITSQDMMWADLPHGVLVVRAWFPNGTMTVNWDDNLYGHPDTWKESVWIDDVTFARVLAEAKAMVTRPSQR